MGVANDLLYTCLIIYLANMVWLKIYFATEITNKRLITGY